MSRSFKDKPLTWVLLAAWAVGLVIVIAALSLRHIAPLPKPSDDVLLKNSLLPYRRHAGGNFLVHVVYSECSCAKSLFGHLFKRKPFPGDEELILFVGSNHTQENLARQSHFETQTVSASELVSVLGLEAAPVLIAFDQAGQVLYAGGYYDNPAAVAPLDEKIHAKLLAGIPVPGLPVFGCAVSSRLRKAVNPLSWN